MKRAFGQALVPAGTLACLALCLVALARSDASIKLDTPSQRAVKQAQDERQAVAPDSIDLNLSDRLADVRVEDGGVRVRSRDGEQLVDAETFLRAVERQQRAARSRHWLLQFFDTTSFLGLIWVAIGLVGQFVFMGRMVVQWLVSEKSRRSVVPTAFWWMSLVGGSMVLAYFIWRRDPVGILGQAMGWVIYARNLWLIYRPHHPVAPEQTATPETRAAAQ